MIRDLTSSWLASVERQLSGLWEHSGAPGRRRGTHPIFRFARAFTLIARLTVDFRKDVLRASVFSVVNVRVRQEPASAAGQLLLQRIAIQAAQPQLRAVPQHDLIVAAAGDQQFLHALDVDDPRAVDAEEAMRPDLLDQRRSSSRASGAPARRRRCGRSCLRPRPSRSTRRRRTRRGRLISRAAARRPVPAGLSATVPRAVPPFRPAFHVQDGGAPARARIENAAAQRVSRGSRAPALQTRARRIRRTRSRTPSPACARRRWLRSP